MDSAVVKKSDKGPAPESKGKSAFNKRKWREQKYSNKAKVLKWENIKRKQALRTYNKELKKSGFSVKDRDGVKQGGKGGQDLNSLYKRAQVQYQKIQEEKEQKRKERELDRQKREEAMKAYKEKKVQRHKKLFQKTRDGKPSMKGRLELLLEKIEKQYGNKEDQ